MLSHPNAVELVSSTLAKLVEEDGRNEKIVVGHAVATKGAR